jgi:hypothetical protein
MPGGDSPCVTLTVPEDKSNPAESGGLGGRPEERRGTSDGVPGSGPVNKEEGSEVANLCLANQNEPEERSSRAAGAQLGGPARCVDGLEIGDPSSKEVKTGINSPCTTTPARALERSANLVHESQERPLLLAEARLEKYFVSPPTDMELRRLRPTRARIRGVFTFYPKKQFRTINNPVKMNHKEQCLFIEKLVKTKNADTKNCGRQAMEKPAKVKSVAWLLQGTAKAQPRKTLARNSWRIWDPGRSEA